MQKNNSQNQLQTLESSPLQTNWQASLDLHVLRYMARRIHLHLLNSAISVTMPSMEYIEERHKRTHRVVIYQQQEYLLQASLLFVGFVSGVQPHVSHAIAQEIHRVDQLFMAELAHNAGLLSYSSLELNPGHWYNLVLLSDLAAKTYFKESSTHRYAAYDLAMHYYAWIRLHNGIMPGGLAGQQMIAQSTKHYTFPAIGQQPVMQELLYSSQQALLPFTSRFLGKMQAFCRGGGGDREGWGPSGPPAGVGKPLEASGRPQGSPPHFHSTPAPTKTAGLFQKPYQ